LSSARVRYLYLMCGFNVGQLHDAVHQRNTHNPPSALIQWPCALLLFFLLGALTQRKAAAQKPSLTSVRARFPFRPGAWTTPSIKKVFKIGAARSVRPVSSAASRSAIAHGSVSPGSPWPPTCSQHSMRACHRSSTRRRGGSMTRADAVTCSGRSRDHGSPASIAVRTRATSRVSAASWGS